MIVFTMSEYYKRFVDDISMDNSGVTIGTCEIRRYPNGEMHVYVNDNVKDEDCFVVGSISPPDEQLVALLMIVNALKRGSPRSIQVFLPYLGYSRQDKTIPGESGGIALIGSLLSTLGVYRIITIDAHSELDRKLIGLPFISIPSTSIFVPSLLDLGWNDITIIAPDEGAIPRTQILADALGVIQPVAYLSKKHENGDIKHLNLVGDVGENVVIVDDIIDTGRTLISTCKILREKGVKKIAVVATHGLFTNDAMIKILELNLEVLFVSDSCPEALRQKSTNLHIFSIKELLPVVILNALERSK